MLGIEVLKIFIWTGLHSRHSQCLFIDQLSKISLFFNEWLKNQKVINHIYVCMCIYIVKFADKIEFICRLCITKIQELSYYILEAKTTWQCSLLNFSQWYLNSLRKLGRKKKIISNSCNQSVEPIFLFYV